MLEIDDMDLQDFEKFKDADLVIDVKRFNEKRSINANAYLWKVCDEIAKALGSDKDTIYLMMLRDFGIFDDIEVPARAVPVVTAACRLTEELYRHHIDSVDGCIEMVGIRCYKGSHEYDRAEFSRLLDGTIQSAHDIGISTWSDEEIERLLNSWEAKI